VRRRLSLALLVVAMASRALAAPVFARRTVTLDTARRTPAFTLPQTAWRSMHRVDLPSPCAQPAALLPDGTIAVALDAPPALAFVSRNGDVVASVRLPARVTRPLAVGRDGRVFVTAGRSLMTVAPDATIRSLVEVTDASASSAFVRDDGTAIVVTTPNHRAIEFVSLTPEGDAARVVGRAGSMLSMPSWLADDRVATTTSDTLVTVDARDVVEAVPCPAGVRQVASQGSTLALTTDSALLLADLRGTVRASVPLGGAPTWLDAIGAGRFAVALVMPNAPCELWIIASGGDVVARVPVPHETRPPSVDVTGAMLVASRSGELVAVRYEGVERWRITTHETLRPPAIPLPRGGVAIATEGNALLLLDEAP
jgi:hypothetical protein